MDSHKLQYSASMAGSSIQAGDAPAAVVNVGENREHLSLLSGSRRQYNRSRSVKVSSLTTGSARTSSQNNIATALASNSLSVSLANIRMLNYSRLIINRRPRGKSAFLVFLILFLETFAFFGALTGARRLLPVRPRNGCLSNDSNHDMESFVLSLLYSSAGRVFYPVAGVLADSYLGRYTVINGGLCLLWMGFATNSLSFSFLHLMSTNVRSVIAALSVILFSAGSGSVEATLIPFGVDQLYQGASSDELSSYFYYYYMARNGGALTAFVLFLIVFDAITFDPSLPNGSSCPATNSEVQYAIQSLLAVVAISVALVILFCMKNHFYQDRQHSNALKLIYRVLSYAATAQRQIPQLNRAFRYGEERKPRIELAKREFDGIFSSEEVEDVKTFYRMLFFLLSLFGYFITYGAGFAYFASQLTDAATEMMRPNMHIHSYLADNIIWIINAGTILIALPLVNHIIIPFWPTANMKLKLGVGFVLHVLSFGIAGFIKWKGHALDQQQFFYWTVLPTIFLSLGESLVFVSGLEFIYAQSPNNMKGLQTGLFYLIFGIFSAVGSTLYYGLNPPGINLAAWFCFILVMIGLVGFVVYVLTACCYKNRQRPTTDGSEYDTQRRLIYEDVFDTSLST